MTMKDDSEAGVLTGEDLDSELRTFVCEVGAAWAKHPNITEVKAHEARKIAETVREPWTRGGPDMVAVTEHELQVDNGTVRVRCYDPGPEGPKPGLVYLHGGGWTIFSLDTHDRVMREYAYRAGVIVIGVDYALAPEAKYPVALEQVCVIARFLGDHGDRIGVDPARIALGGDSAGGNLSIAAGLALRWEGRPDLIKGLLLNYGVFDRRISRESRRRYGGAGYMLSSEDMEWFWQNYLNSDDEADDPLVCPINADLRGLPPTQLVVAECDVLAEQNIRMAERLRSAGVAVDFRLCHGAPHSFLEAVTISSLAARALDESAQWLRQILVVQ